MDIEWNPIDIPKEQEVAQMTSQSAQYVSSLCGNNIITVAEGRSMLRRTNLPAFQAITPEVPELLEKIEKGKDPAMQGGGGGMPGMPGAGGPQGGGEGQGEEQPQQPDPQVAQNDQIFKSALQKVMAEKQQGGETEQAGQPPQNGQQPSDGGVNWNMAR